MGMTLLKKTKKTQRETDEPNFSKSSTSHQFALKQWVLRWNSGILLLKDNCWVSTPSVGLVMIMIMIMIIVGLEHLPWGLWWSMFELDTTTSSESLSAEHRSMKFFITAQLNVWILRVMSEISRAHLLQWFGVDARQRFCFYYEVFMVVWNLFFLRNCYYISAPSSLLMRCR